MPSVPCALRFLGSFIAFSRRFVCSLAVAFVLFLGVFCHLCSRALSYFRAYFVGCSCMCAILDILFDSAPCFFYVFYLDVLVSFVVCVKCVCIHCVHLCIVCVVPFVSVPFSLYVDVL